LSWVELSWVELSWVELSLRPRSIRLSIGNPYGPMSISFFSLIRQLLCSYLGCSLWREDGSVLCSTHTH
jgi:hypothetical protein